MLIYGVSYHQCSLNKCQEESSETEKKGDIKTLVYHEKKLTLDFETLKNCSYKK